MSSSLAWAAPVANTATAPTQVVSRKLRIDILPATVPRVTDARAHAVLAGRHPLDGKTSGSVSQRNGDVGSVYAPPGLRGYVRTPVTPDVLEAESRKKPIPATNRSQPSFWAFVERAGLDAAKNFHKAQNIERLLRE